MTVSSDIAAVLADLASLGIAVTVTVGATSTSALYDEQAVEYFGGAYPDLTGNTKGLVILTGTLGAIANGSTITVAGTPYRVRDTATAATGLLTRILLET